METSKNDKKNCLIPYRTVVIEDQTLFRDILVHLVESDSDYSLVGKASSGTEGWEVCRQTKPDLILTDYFMPNMTGAEMASSLRKIGFKGPIVGVTAAIIGNQKDELQSSGVDIVLSKPLTSSNFKSAILQLRAAGKLNKAGEHE